ncbi:MAG: HAMP domain-containing histidine kinase [Candidatus Ancillula sp.]|jgi:signal transduction histidine kinase|nr:HAMP domain-containing histidine kinase [Candidatus Ancillula sp.]
MKKQATKYIMFTAITSVLISLLAFMALTLIGIGLTFRNSNNNIRISIIDKEGYVKYQNWMLNYVGDSYKLDIKDIPEVAKALDTGFGYDEHLSKTENIVMCYFAVKISNNEVFQISGGKEQLYKTFMMIGLIAFFLIMFFFIIVRIVSSHFVTRFVKSFSVISNLDRIGTNEAKGLTTEYPEIKTYVDKILDHENEQRKFIANISHEFKSPISNIANSYYILTNTNGITDSDADMCNQIINTEIKFLSYLIPAILELSKSNSGKIFSISSTFDIKDVVNRVISVCRGIISKKDIEIQVQAIDSIDVMGNSVLLEAAVRNLLDNALNQAQLKITIKLSKKVEEDIEFASVVVINDGMTISEEEQLKIFGRFHQGNNADKVDNNYGIGLSIVQKIMQVHGGLARLNYSKGNQTEFEILIPVVD